jgi:hypothetical protein
VTTGGYSNTRGGGYALGVCAMRALWALGAFHTRGSIEVRVRNPTELVTWAARLRIRP